MRQLNKTKRRLCIGAFAVVAAPLLLASVAAACTSLKNLQTSSTSGAAGVTLRVTGTNFNKTGANAVEIRMDSRSAAPIASLDVALISATGGAIALDVVIPANAALGYHTLIATQTSSTTGALMSGFPVRAAYKVTAVTAGRAGDAEPAAAAAAAAEPATSPAATQTAPAAAASAPAPASTPTASSATSGVVAVPAAAASTAAVPAAEATRPGAVDPGAGSASASSASSAAGPAPAAPAAAVTPSLGAAPVADRSTVVSSGLVAAASRRSASALPGLTFALGAAMVLLSLAAFVKSGRSVVGGRRLTTLA